MGFLKFIKGLIKNSDFDEEDFFEEDIKEEEDSFEEEKVDDLIKNKEIKDYIEDIEPIELFNKNEEKDLSEEEIDELILKEIYEVITIYDDFEKAKSAARKAAINIGKSIRLLAKLLKLKN